MYSQTLRIKESRVAGDGGQLGKEYLPSTHTALLPPPALDKMGLMIDVEAETSKVHGLSQLQSELEASLGYMRPYL